jgi:hypothetical protein
MTRHEEDTRAMKLLALIILVALFLSSLGKEII